MAKRVPDVVRIETSAGSCEIVQNCQLARDLMEVANLTMTIGDDGSWQAISNIVLPGNVVRLYLNGRLQFTGRFETNTVPTSPAAGSVAQIIARTKLSDAHYASADPTVKYKNETIKTFLLKLFAQLGYTAADFNFDANSDRNLITGQKVGLPTPVDLGTTPGLGQADTDSEGTIKLQPQETIKAAAERHLRRHHLMLWDGADGRIVVGKPDDKAVPTYRFQSKRGARATGNNLISCERIVDWSEVPSSIRVTGQTLTDDGDPKYLLGLSVDRELLAVAATLKQFNRTVTIPVEGAKTQARAQAQADRERSLRSKNKDAWRVALDEWTFWDGTRSIPWSLNTTGDVDIDTIGAGAAGRYYLFRIVQDLDVHGSGTSHIYLAAPGIIVA